MFLMQFGGIVIGGVSLLEKTGEYESPYWFSVVKWGRSLSGGLTVYFQ